MPWRCVRVSGSGGGSREGMLGAAALFRDEDAGHSSRLSQHLVGVLWNQRWATECQCCRLRVELRGGCRGVLWTLWLATVALGVTVFPSLRGP